MHAPVHHHHEEHHPEFRWALVLTLAFAVVEAAGGVWAKSLALISDAGHMFTDAGALALATLGAWVARRPPSVRHSYGLLRAEVIAALVNSFIMLLLITWIVVKAVERLLEPQPVAGGAVMVIAVIGLLVNIVVALVLSRGEQSLNSRAALLHVLGDLLGSVAALMAGAVIFFTGWMPIDPILSLAVAALILGSTIQLLRQALHVLMEGVPGNLSLEEVGLEMARIQGVQGVHDLHIWNLSSGRVALSAHLELENLDAWPEILDQTRAMLHHRFHIEHVTLQPEITPLLKPPYEKSIPIYPK